MADDLEKRRQQERDAERAREAYAEEQRRIREAREALKGLLGDEKKADPPDDSDDE